MPHAKDFRNVLEHIDRYLLGCGDLQNAGKFAKGVDMLAVHERATGRVTLRWGEHELDLDEASEAALALADVTADVWSARGGQ